MRRTAFACLAAALIGAPAAAEDAAVIAERGAALLDQAALALFEASSSSEEVRALTATVEGYETGLAALREALRQADRDEGAIRARLAPRQEALTDLIVFLQRQTRVTETLPLAHPGGALPAIRAGMIAADMSPDLGDEVTALLDDLAELEAVVALQEASRDQLRAGAREARTARLALTTAVAERRGPPDPFSTDTAAMQALINSSETLAAFADSLSVGEGAAPTDDALWPLPVRGARLRGFNDADAAGVRRPGWVIETTPEALVTAPVETTVRFAGQMPDGRGVAILEPRAGEMLILAGLDQIFLERDDIVAKGDPIGLMPPSTAPDDLNLIETDFDGGQPSTETLYIEIRRRATPVDPADRFRGAPEEG